MKRILVTGPNGFVGGALCAELIMRGFAVRGAHRQAAQLPDGCESFVVGDINAQTDWAAALRDVDAVVHLAARVHIMKDAAADPLAEFLKVNVEGTRRLAEEGVKAGVSRLVFTSSVKVNGEETETPYAEVDAPNPRDAYGISKLEAECVLRDIGKDSDMVVVICRPPLIYGPMVKGNFLSLLRIAKTGLPLPFGAIRNQRSLVYVVNLVDFIIRCIEHPAAGHETFLVSDGSDVSTSYLLRQIRSAMGKPPRLLPVPPSLLYLLGRLTGKAAFVDRLCGSLRVDSSKARRVLGWEPPFTVQQGLQDTVRAFMS